MIDYEEVDGKWSNEMPEGGGLPVTEEEYIQNLRTNLKRDLPNVKGEKEHDRIMVMVCGGPTAKLFLEEIREKNLDPRYDVFCSNKTHDWLIENGIKPHCQFIIDPKPGKIKDVQNPVEGVKYIIAAQCHPDVFEALKGYDVHRIVSCSGTKAKCGLADHQIAAAILEEDSYTNLFGGTMAGLRAMNLGETLGYLTVEFYGFDSCFFEYDEHGQPIHYSYFKPRAEDIYETETTDGRRWLTTPVFASQARQYLKWKHRLEWMKFVIHGDSFTAALDRLDDIAQKRDHNRRFSENHIEENAKLIQDKENFAQIGKNFAGDAAILAGQIVRKYGPQTLLDYGCGKGLLVKMLPQIEGLTVKMYDPAVPEYSAEPEPADIVICTDVLEHIELDCIENVLDHLQELTKKVCFCTIAQGPSQNRYSDGRNVHLIIKDAEWWYPKLRKRFDIVEQKFDKLHYTCVLQKKGISDELHVHSSR